MRRGLASLVKSLGVHAILLSGAFIMVYPFLWMWNASVESSGEVFGAMKNAPSTWESVLSNYGQALFATPVLRFMLNGVLVTGGILFFQIITTVTCAYALAKLDFRGKRLLLAIVLFAITIPAQAPALPLYIGLAKLQLLDTYLAMMVPHLTSAFAIFLFRQFIRSFPDEILLAARLDGMTEIEIVARIVAPSMLPAIAAFSIFSVTYHWNDLYWPMIVIHSVELAPPTLGILFFRSQEGGDSFGPLMACATIVTTPLILVFIAAQKKFVQGVTMTGIK